MKIHKTQAGILALATGSVFLAASVTGCGGGNTDQGDNTSGNQTRQISRGQQYRSLQFTVTSRSAVPQGESVPVELTVTNIGTKGVAAAVVYYLDAAVAFRNAPVWHYMTWRRQSPTPSAIWEIRLKPGESRTYSPAIQWDRQDSQGNPVASGRYSLTAWLPVYAYGEGEFGEPGKPPEMQPLTQEEQEQLPKTPPLEIEVE